MLTIVLASTTLAAALLASGVLAPSGAASGGAAPPADPPGLGERPSMTIRVHAAGDVAPSLVRGVLAEADAVWRSSGFRFEWRVVRDGETTGDFDSVVSPLPTPRVIIGDERGMDTGSSARPLGWIVFDSGSLPGQEIHVSRSNAVWLLGQSAGVVGPVDRMPPLQQQLLLARAMGRALAHELGHYLLASKQHTEAGLMRGRQPAVGLFGSHREGYAMDAAQRGLVARRLNRGQSIGVGR